MRPDDWNGRSRNGPHAVEHIARHVRVRPAPTAGGADALGVAQVAFGWGHQNLAQQAGKQTNESRENSDASRCFCSQVSFNYGHDNQGNESVAKKLSGLDRDCFIIPVHSLDRFLPSGVPMPVGISWLV